MAHHKIYLPNLNGLRAIAAIVVVIYHFDNQICKPINLTSFKIYNSNTSASLAVTLFFVLSGYLITYLLLLEKTKNLKSILHFYYRRIYRIWPVYYSIIVITILGNLLFYDNFFSKPEVVFYIGTYSVFGGNLLNLSNVPSYFTPLIVLWSVGIEEQFYLLWPWIIKRLKRIELYVSFIIFFCIAFRVYASYTNNNHLLGILYNSRIDCMAIGSLGAIIMLKKSHIKQLIEKYLFTPIFQLVIWSIFISAFIPNLYIQIFSVINSDFYSVFFLLIIISISHPKSTFRLFENKFFNSLGKISYGIYMYHLLLGYFITEIILRFDIKLSSSVIIYFVYLILFLLITIGTSFLSYNILENYFLKKKTKYIHI